VLDGLAITPTSADGAQLALNATATESNGHATVTSATQILHVDVNPVADKPSFTVTAAAPSINEGGTVALTITPPFETDPDATNTVTVSGLAGATLNHGTRHADGSVSLQQSDLAGLTLQAPDSDLASITLQVMAQASEGGTTASSTQSITIPVIPAAETPTLSIAASSIFTPVDVPGAIFTFAFGINNADQIVGSSVDASSTSPAFLDSGGSFSLFAVPLAAGSDANGINDAGHIVGTFSDNNGFLHGFLDIGGAFSRFDFPNASFTNASGINNADQIVGDSATTGSWTPTARSRPSTCRVRGARTRRASTTRGRSSGFSMTRPSRTTVFSTSAACSRRSMLPMRKPPRRSGSIMPGRSSAISRIMRARMALSTPAAIS
jgi:probable HAF family extracellular repeat protein